MGRDGFVYILASKGKRLYTGVTSQLEVRVRQHKARLHPHAHTARYNINLLVYYEHYGSIADAINREAQIKNMHRIDKVALIVGLNPAWEDLSLRFGKPTGPVRQGPPQSFPS